MELKPGVYENIINGQLKADIEEADGRQLVCPRENIDAAEMSSVLSDYLAKAIKNRLDDDDMDKDSKVGYVNRLIGEALLPQEDILVEPAEMLTQVITRQEAAALRNARGSRVVRPQSGFRVSTLFTGGQEGLSLAEEIRRDIASADQICMIVSFLKMSGTRLLMDRLSDFCSRDGHRLRIITTTYCGITEGKAVEQLSRLPNTEIRISYATNIERLHAKAYIFQRNSGLSTAYIGSSNLSRSAQTDGLEWNIRVTNMENPHLIKAALATFERYWESDSFEDFNVGGIEKFNRETRNERQTGDGETRLYPRFTLLPHQKQILDKLDVERLQRGNSRNLVVAATGTGKTVISAFDYKRHRDAYPLHSRLLFVAHREEILKQSLATYRSVLGDFNFGDLWVGSNKPHSGLDHLFVSVQTFSSKIKEFNALGQNYYDFIVIDEAHHVTASSYRALFSMFSPKILLGLTATPERMDGASLLPDFGGRISAEIRLPKALSEGLLTPFQYLCITDSVDLSDDELWQGNKYITSKLSDRLCNSERASLIISKLAQYLPDETKCRALAFCTDMKHAEFMAEMFRLAGLRAAALTSKTNEEERKRLNKQLGRGDINYLFVVDIFNEGVDIPEVDTALFLRPTESLTIFLQQLGRGLRLSAGKQYLTVLDFVAQANNHFDFASRFRALMTRTDANIGAQVAEGFTLLPPGCSIMMEEKAREYILDNIHGAIYNISRLARELMGYDHVPSLSEFLASNGQDIRLIYRNNGCWTDLKRRASKCGYGDDEMTAMLSRNMGRLVHINTPGYIEFIRRFIQDGCKVAGNDEKTGKYALMLYYALFQCPISNTKFATIDDALNAIGAYPLFVSEMSEICDYLMEHLENTTMPLTPDYAGLELHGCYDKNEIFILLGRQTATQTMQGMAAGVLRLDETQTEVFFVTLNKSEKEFSPSTQYKDYFISENHFHWQSQNTDSHAKSGKRFVEQKSNGKKFILFVRESKRDGYGNTCPFHCLGYVDYIRSSGDFPMNIEWHLRNPAMPCYVQAV